MGLVWSAPLSFKGNNRESPKKGGGPGETYRRWGGGSKKRFWGGVFRRIYGMFSTPLSFPPPWPLSEKSFIWGQKSKFCRGNFRGEFPTPPKEPWVDTACLRGPAAILFISRDTCSDRKTLSCLCFYGVSHNYRAIRCKTGNRTDVRV